MANIFKKALKKIGSAPGISGSSSPVVIDPVKQEAEQKRLAQVALNTRTAANVQKAQASSINPNSLDTSQVASNATNIEANTQLTQKPITPDPKRWRVLKGIVGNMANTLGRV